ncbi:PREDICTED: active regulator of SIRT1 [Gekko japonicus]|uniref:Active regulator of SIRT1 n=1 Tax=Gekko japonicus TaxID=146911 RepID=A0ABM1KLV9_GEKJA|nr:PREDICTED: active regulator of SIRT1 [Gekko japonicus]
MSVSLLRKGLELLEASTVSASRPKGTATTATQPKKQLLTRKKKKIVSRRTRDKATVKGKVTKSVLEEYKKLQAVDHFQENLQYMMSSQFVTGSAITQKVLAQNRGRKARDHPETEAKKKKPEGTVFTDEDFQKFEKEYFPGVVNPN